MTIFAKPASAVIAICLLRFLLGSRFSEKKRSGMEKLTWYGLCAAIVGLAELFLELAVIPALLWALAAGLLAWRLMDTRPTQVLSAALLAGLLRAAALGVALLLRRTFPGLERAAVIGPELTGLFALVICVALLNPKWRGSPRPLLPLIPCWLVAVVLSGEIIRQRRNDSAMVLVFFCLVWLMYCGWRAVSAGQKMEQQSHALQGEKQRAQYYALQEEYYEQLCAKQVETRALWHDMDKYLRAAQAEGTPGETLERLKAMVSSAAEIVDVGNRVLNVILNEYAQAAKAAGIRLNLHVQVPEELFVSIADLYVIIGNTMDNAIEACRALPLDRRQIDLRLRMHHDVLYYRVENPVSPNYGTSRRDERRGYGITNARKCVERYHGSLEIDRETERFIVTAHMNRV